METKAFKLVKEKIYCILMLCGDIATDDPEGSQIYKNLDLAEEMGKKGKEIVRNNFLITRLLLDYLDLLNEIIVPKT